MTPLLPRPEGERASRDVADAVTSASLDELVDEVQFLWLQRTAAVRAPHVDRQQFADLDESIAAHIDAVVEAGEAGWIAAQVPWRSGQAEDAFLSAVLVLESSPERWERCLASSSPTAFAGMLSALGWASPRKTGPVRAALLSSARPHERKLGIAACGLQRIDPGEALGRLIADPHPGVRTRALRAAGELGRVDLLPQVLEAIDPLRPELCYWAARSGLLLGDRRAAATTLADIARADGPRRGQALGDLLRVLPLPDAHELLMELEGSHAARRLRIVGTGTTGDARYAPWLLGQMEDPASARIAGEAFVAITGADFNLDRLESMPPEGHEDGPSDDPDDDRVELPADIALPWPDVPAIKAWWTAHRDRLPPGCRFFLGQPVTADHCAKVLKTGLQRQRVGAAHHRALAQVGTVLFPTSAPAWRQAAWLDTL